MRHQDDIAADRIDTHTLVATLLRRRQDTIGVLFSLLDLIVLTAGDLPVKDRYSIGHTLRDAADRCEIER
jgi:hypothetical protein